MANDRMLKTADQLARELQAEIEQLRVQLAGCGVAAVGGSPVAKQGDYGWSVSYQDVLNLRRKYDDLRLWKAKQ